jgi:beta-galactosidase
MKNTMRQIALTLAAAVSLAPTASSLAWAAEAPIPTQLPGRNALLMGADWYPEQWPEARWETDLKLMAAAHFTVVRIAEFAWSTMEPAEGRYDFAWLDRAVRLSEKHGLAVVLSTPTATPPAWLTEKYPETLRVEPNGQRVERAGAVPRLADRARRHPGAALRRDRADREGVCPCPGGLP